MPENVLTPLEIGSGRVEQGKPTYLIIEDVPANRYSDAQLFDYPGRKRVDFPDTPPLRMSVRAWASHDVNELKGTAGFGFWNQPVMPGQILPRLPRAIWFFFGSKPSNMALAQGVPGYGWKAATIDASRLAFMLLAPGTPLGFLLMRNPTLYDRLWPIAQRVIGVSEMLIDVDLKRPHTYRLDWLREVVRFYVDGQLILETNQSPRGPLGFVTWIDNQYAVVTPQGNLGMGLIPVPGKEWLALEELVIERL